MNERFLADQDYSRRLGPALRLLREARNVPQRTVADRASITHATYSDFERGRKTPTFPMLVKVLSALDADLTTLEEAIRSVQVLSGPGSAPPPGWPPLRLI
jgi:transcriptional regulator with XRE-family HTH domain